MVVYNDGVSWDDLCRSPGTIGASLGGSAVKNPPANAGDMGSVPGSGRSPGEGNGNTLQYSCLGHPTDRGAQRATVHGVTKNLDMTQGLTNTTTSVYCVLLCCDSQRLQGVAVFNKGLHQANSLAPFYQWHSLPQNLCVMFWDFLPYFTLFHDHFICYGVKVSILFFFLT